MCKKNNNLKNMLLSRFIKSGKISTKNKQQKNEQTKKCQQTRSSY